MPNPATTAEAFPSQSEQHLFGVLRVQMWVLKMSAEPCLNACAPLIPKRLDFR